MVLMIRCSTESRWQGCWPTFTFGASPLSAGSHGDESPVLVKRCVWILDKRSGGLHCTRVIESALFQHLCLKMAFLT